MTMSADSNSSGLLSSLIIASATWTIPEAVITYGEKILSVFVLAMIAEMGRRLIALFWRNK